MRYKFRMYANGAVEFNIKFRVKYLNAISRCVVNPRS